MDEEFLEYYNKGLKFSENNFFKADYVVPIDKKDKFFALGYSHNTKIPFRDIILDKENQILKYSFVKSIIKNKTVILVTIKIIDEHLKLLNKMKKYTQNIILVSLY
ncbi:MAG: hypothetical protein PWP46_2201 [Fusobacteriaceae bacterium]|jgi:glutamine phosphoribosylpyrophosphate amidotransferase|nr:hypothetical protein [Fusobacteriales bacterium]MDN5305314.1 hypothetical protein [Fusobacteriaceae bacterium]